ncbi:MAG: PilZ domain-containing protein [Sulfuricella sp.]|nr:PilZ domain-containing protein [Sulfuricella sp.]
MSAIGGVYFQGNLPLAWHAAEPPGEETLQGWMFTNAVLLRALATMDAQPTERDVDPNGDADRKLERLEAKLDLALNLLAQLIARDAPKPEACPATLSATAIEWFSSKIPATGNLVITLYLDPRLPQPLQLPAQVLESAPAEGGHRTLAEFHHLDEETQEWLERMVFRRHRRHIQALHGAKG